MIVTSLNYCTLQVLVIKFKMFYTERVLVIKFKMFYTERVLVIKFKLLYTESFCYYVCPIHNPLLLLFPFSLLIFPISLT